MLLDWLSKDPAINTNTTPGNKRKSKGGEGDDSLDKSGDGSLTPTRSKKRILFSQSMIGNPLLNPESGHVLETTSEEDVLLGTVVGEESFVISPVVVGDNSTSRVNRGSQEDGDKTLVENTTEENEARDEVEVTTVADISKNKDDTEEFGSAESSLNTGDEADDTVEQGQDPPKLVATSYDTESVEVSKAGTMQPTATIDIEILAASDEDDEEEDDIFSDASSVASINLSKLPKGAVLDNFSSQSQPNPKKVKLLKLNHQNQLYPTDPPQILQSHHPTCHLFPLTVQMSPPLLLVLAAVHEGGGGGGMGWQHCQVGHGGAGGSCGAGF